MSKSNYNTLFQFFLSRGQYEKIPQDWADANKNLITEKGYGALMYFFPIQVVMDEKEAEENLAYLNATCGRGQ